nr:uncharacterized protein LOC129283295 [Lytechinus pictus]
MPGSSSGEESYCDEIDLPIVHGLILLLIHSYTDLTCYKTCFKRFHMYNTRLAKKMAAQSQETHDICEQISDEVREYFKSKEFRDLFKLSFAEAMTREIQALRERLEQTESKVMDLETELQTQASILTSLQKEKVSTTDAIKSLKAKLNEEEQYLRRNCLRLYGILESDYEDTDAVMVNLANKDLGVNVTLGDIDRSHRVGAPRRPVDKMKPPRPIIVKFSSYRVRNLVIKNRKRLKGKHIGIEEDLTATNIILLQKAKDEMKNKSNVTAAWSTDGKITVLVKATNGRSLKKRINSVDDLKKIG